MYNDVLTCDYFELLITNSLMIKNLQEINTNLAS